MVFKFISTEKIRRLHYTLIVMSNAARTGLSERVGGAGQGAGRGAGRGRNRHSSLDSGCQVSSPTTVASTHKNYNYWAPPQTTESKTTGLGLIWTILSKDAKAR